jgi:signal peptidase II
MSPARLGWLCAALVLAADLVTKWWILAVAMNPPRIVEVAPFFNLVLVKNRGVSFGMLGSAPGWMPWVLTAFAVTIAIALAVWLCRADGRLLGCALGAVIGGAIGNAIDRVRFGAVVDFLDFHAFGWHWPAFNVADSAVVVGVGLLVLDSLKSGARNP